MTEHGITAYSPLDEGRIHPRDYTNSLIEEALRVGRIGEEDVERLRTELVSRTLPEVMGYYTRNESTSLKAETVRQLSLSMMFNLDTALRKLNDPEKALAALLESRTSELYGKGYLINAEQLRTAKNLYGKVRLSRRKDGGPEYDKALDRYFRYYLANYDPKFHAHLKLYLSLPKYRIRGNFTIHQTVTVLKKLLEINLGSGADVVMELPETENSTGVGAESEPNN